MTFGNTIFSTLFSDVFSLVDRRWPTCISLWSITHRLWLIYMHTYVYDSRRVVKKCIIAGSYYGKAAGAAHWGVSLWFSQVRSLGAV